MTAQAETRTAPAPVPRRRGWSRLHLAGLAMAAPATIFILVFSLIPVVYGLYLSLTRYNPLRRGGPEWIGLSNYASLADSPQFWRALGVTGLFVLMVLPPTVLIATGLAVLVNVRVPGIGAIRSALYIPNIISLTAVSMIWLWMYSQHGLFNQIFAWFGLPEQALLYDERTALAAAAVMRVWKALGSNMVLLLAGLQSIPNELYEAARVDGAGKAAQFRHVTVPGLRPMLVFVIAMDIIYLSQSFAEIYVLTQGGPLASTTTVNYLIYTTAFQYNQFGLSSAMAFVLFAFVAGLSVITMRNRTGDRP
ncbi:MAG: sugar ABC transporter permease [Propionibacteriaceae bacterium]|jgi:ABC-type sugar transport system permease subunit|nr:sugar ABC transporter permease [Propionibacteriaceae bacterium]